jgi:hypothetical protein
VDEELLLDVVGVLVEEEEELVDIAEELEEEEEAELVDDMDGLDEVVTADELVLTTLLVVVEDLGIVSA